MWSSNKNELQFNLSMMKSDIKIIPNTETSLGALKYKGCKILYF